MIVGCKTKFYGESFKFPAIQKRDFIEEVYMRRIQNLKGSKLKVPRLRLEWDTQQGGIKKVHKFERLPPKLVVILVSLRNHVPLL